MELNVKHLRVFQNTVWAYYRKHKRKLPWRAHLIGGQAPSAWKVLVSEVMLQQTQASRVVPFYKEFVKRFPMPRSLALARFPEVLHLWSGLGYNRRALSLKRAAETIVREHNGEVPHDLQKLDALPGIGANTAAAILAYAWNEPVVFVETNIRTVFFRHFFPKKKKIRDEEILELVEKTLPKENTTTPSRFARLPSSTEEGRIRHWYSALMDYGAHLKKTTGNPNARSACYAKQTRFAGSVRQMRGEILRRALAGTLRARDFPSGVLADLVREGFLQKQGRSFILFSK